MANGVGAALGQGVEVVAVIALARNLAPTDVATYFLVLQGIRFSYILESGMGQEVTRSLAGTSQSVTPESQRVLKAGVIWYLWLFTISTGVVVVATLIALGSKSQVDGKVLFLVGFAATLRILSDGCSRALTGLMLLIGTRTISFVRSLGLLVVALCLAPIGTEAFGLGVLGLEAVLLMTSLIPLGNRIRSCWSRSRYSREEYRLATMPMAKANVTAFLSNRLDGFFVGLFVGAPAVVVHGILLRIYEGSRGGVELLMTGVIQASSVSSREKNKAALSSILIFSFGVSTIVSAVAGVLIFAARPLLDAAFPQQIYVSTWSYLAVAIALVTVSQSVAYTYVATGLNLVDRLLFGVYFSSAVNFATTLIATRFLGAAGPFVGIAAGGLVSAFAYPRCLRHEVSDWTDGSKIRRIRITTCLIFPALVTVSFLIEWSPVQVGVACAALLAGGLIMRIIPLKEFLKVAHGVR